jgi:hypothetical protein
MSDPAKLYAQLTKAFEQRAWLKVKELVVRMLPFAPGHPAIHYMAGVACMELQEPQAAAECLRKATLLEPSQVGFQVQFAKALTLASRNREAREAADRALALSPRDPATLDTLGVVYTQVGAHAIAADVFRQAAALAPRHAPFRFNLATSLVATGEVAAAEAELEACVALDPRHWRAHVTLAQLRRQTPEDNHVARLESLLRELGSPPPSSASMFLHMALAKEYEDLGQYSTSFDHLAAGKAAGAAELGYSSRRDEEMFAALIEGFEASGPSAEGQAVRGDPTEEPIFIIGMPRSGTTLVERIVSSHPDVFPAGEMLNFAMAVKRLSQSRSPALVDADVIRRACRADLSRLGEIYLGSTRPRTGHTARFVDKLPHNFLYAGFIANALPNAKIVCLRRDPMDTCLSNFRQLFGIRSPFFDYSFDLLDTGRYYVLFDRLMAHWQRVLPGRILEIRYEDLVDSQEASSRRLLEFCGLSWHEACLRFEDNATPVATASAVQVRAPIYRSSLQRWKKYGEKLHGLRDLLTQAGITVDA